MGFIYTVPEGTQELCFVLFLTQTKLTTTFQ